MRQGGRGRGGAAWMADCRWVGVALVLAAAVAARGGEAAGRPHVVLILADDLGYEAIGANGGTSYATPVLDRLAAEGARFTQCYAQPLCTPTRAQVMTGAVNKRNYTSFGKLDPQLSTLGQLFLQAGYRTCIVGKWQLGRQIDLPKRFGFEESYLWQHMRRPPRYANPGLEINGEERDYTRGEYGPDLLEEFAEEFVARRDERPFFLYYPLTLTHGPYQPTPDSPDWDPRSRGEKVLQAERHFGEMVTYMDKLLGRLLAKLESCGARENTLVMFLGDNGTGRGVRSRMGERTVVGGKGQTTARGMHVPMIVDWPGRVQRGQVVDDLVDTTDVMPTLCEAAGITLPTGMPIDGRSFLPQVRGEKGRPREWIYAWYSPHGEPAREFSFTQRHKLYADGTFFDLAADIDEQRPLAVAELTGEAGEAAEMLRRAIESFADARPAAVARQADQENRQRRRGGE